MSHPTRIHTISSRAFASDVDAAKRAATECGTVLITENGEPVFVLLSIGEYRRIMDRAMNPVDPSTSPDA